MPLCLEAGEGSKGSVSTRAYLAQGKGYSGSLLTFPWTCAHTWCPIHTSTFLCAASLFPHHPLMQPTLCLLHNSTAADTVHA